ncbi:MAG: hypothetical protein IKC11_01325 [Clostridia bacterium]|nr:hypothetical protein [Clostridia bacterium]
MKNGYLGEMSPKIKMELLSLLNDFYTIEKQHTVVVMPFFGLLHSQGNECKPFFNYVDINILDLMNNQFRDVIVYPGENRYLSSYGLPLTVVEHLAHEQNLLSRIVNKTTNFDRLSDRHKEILYLYEKALDDFDTMKEKYPLPYRTAFSIQTPEDLISFVKQLDIKIKQEDRDNRICLVCPISYLIDYPRETYNLLAETIKTIDGTLYFAQNQSDKYLYSTDYQMLFDEQYDEKFIQSIQDFAITYNEDMTRKAKKRIHFDSIIDAVQNGDYGSSEGEIIKNLGRTDILKPSFATQLNKTEEILNK